MNEAQLSSLMEEFARTRDPVLRDQLVEAHLPMSRAVARKFAGHGVELEDLEQVAAMALVKAIDRFDFSRNLKFSTFAMPTMAGEVRNYIRDKGSVIRMSRDARSQLYRMRQLRDQLTQDLRREPSMKELAAAMDITYDELLSLLDARDSSEVMSLNSAMSSDEDAQELEERLGVRESGYERVEQQQWLQWIFQQVTPQEKKLLELRFMDCMGQRDTARQLGVSQMQVSRMERRILSRLREHTERWQASY